MPDLKISQLTDGGAAQATDEFVVARGGGNNKITAGNVTSIINASATQSGSALVNQADIGSAPNEIPLNQYLGTMAYQDAAGVNIAGGTATLTTLDVNGNVGVTGGGFTVNNTATDVDNSVRNLTATGTTGETAGISFDVANNVNGVRIYGKRDGTYASAGTRIASFCVATTVGGVESEKFVISGDGNLGLGTTTFGTSAAKVLAIGSGTEPSTSPADTIQLYSVDRSAGNTIPALRCEGTGVTDAGITNTTVTNKIAIKVNGTVYYLLATTNAT